ncbi:hypothetical protein F5Y15DRAFT_338275 [Xylariaceae sp. FL0016]|nr:hypothetical protein F5Y15DRAFT_338275 [Xylariaceae sp. FL0016]
MAEPTNTPMPTAPPTPRSNSPAPPLPGSLSSSPTATTTTNTRPSATSGQKPIVLHLGDPVKYHPELYSEFTTLFDVVRPAAEERNRPAFAQALREGRWGRFAAIFRSSLRSGGEMGMWDEELIGLLPGSVKIFAGAGGNFDRADTKGLRQRGIAYCDGSPAANADAEALADIALALIISTFRALPHLISSASTAPSPTAVHLHATSRSHSLRGRVLGLVGFDILGQQIAQRAGAGFGMQIAYHDVQRRGSAVEARLQARYCASLETLFRDADCVVYCAPISAGKVITRESLAWCKPGARLINFTGEVLVDEEALADAMEEEQISSVALDVEAGEPPRLHERLRKFVGDRALLICRGAGETAPREVEFEELSMRNIMAVLGGGSAITPQWPKEP